MNNLLPLIYVVIFLYVDVRGEECPKVCICETAALSKLPINSVLVKTQHNHTSEEPLPTYHSLNEVLDEADEHEVKHNLEKEEMKAVTCVLQPTNNLALFHSLSPETQVLTILQGSWTGNITLDESYFQYLQSLVVLEIHGFQHDHGHLNLRNNALKHLILLRYLNLQHVHLLGDRSFGNRPAPKSSNHFLESKTKPGAVTTTFHETEGDSNTIPEPVQFVPNLHDMDIVPYNVYREQQERAGLSTFAGLHSLEFLRAFHCNIKEVNWEMFEGLQKLQYLSLEGNTIPFLQEFSFYGTPNLKHLVLSHNKLLDIQSTSLAGLLNLEILDVSYNNITHLTEFSLPPLPALITADFHHNPTEFIMPHTFQVLNNTQQLFLGGKKARLEIRPNSFVGLNKLHKMSMNGVHLEVLESEYLKGMPHLRELRMEGMIHELSFDAFTDVPKLQELILKNCSIRKISMDAFFGLYGLVYLDLSHNELVTLPPSLFDHQQSLKEINLHNNKLTTLPTGIFIHTSAKLIRLDKNPWHCTCLMNEWQPSQINKVKTKITDTSFCQSRYDKGSMCKIHYKYQYVYEQSVTPRCTTPTRYNGWSVFHLLRKHLRCDKMIYKHKALKENARGKHHEESLSKKTKFENPYIKNEQPIPVTSSSKSTIGIPLTSTDSTLKLKAESSTPAITFESQSTEYGQNNESQVINLIPDNQRMWTERNKEKYRQELKKEKMLEQKFKPVTVKKDRKTQENFRIHIDPAFKTKKKTDIRKKWEMKMKNTMESLNKIPKNDTDIS